MLDDDDLTIEFTDELPITAKTVLADPLPTFTRINFISRVRLLGQVFDPTFGLFTSSLYAQIQMQPNNAPNFETATRVDSAVLIFDYVPEATFGDPEALHFLEVIKVVESMDIADTIFSDQDFATNGEVIASRFFKPSQADSVEVFDPGFDTGAIIQNIILVPMTRGFTFDLFGDRSADDSPEAFLEFLNGVHIRTTTEENSIFGIDLSSNALNTGLIVYYQDEDENPRQYQYFLNRNQSVRPSRFEHDYSGTVVEQSIGIEIEGDEPLYMHGMAGVDVEIDISSIHTLDDILINYAELEFFLAGDLLSDTILFPPAQVAGLYYLDGGTFTRIDDLENAVRAQRIQTFFKGGLEMDEEKQLVKYTMNLTAHIKRVYDGELDPQLLLSVFDKTQNPNYSILYGPGHSTYPAKLKLTFTRP